MLERHGHAGRIDHRTLAAQRDEALARGDTARAETLDRDPEIHLGRSAWIMARTDEDNARTERNDRIVRATAIASRSGPPGTKKFTPSRSRFRAPGTR